MSRDSRGTSPNADRVVRSWLREDRHEDANRVLGAVLDELDATPQRRATPWAAWRELFVDNNIVRVGLVAAAVVVIVVVGIQLIGGPGVGGPGATETPEPTSTPEPTPQPTAAGGGLPLGPLVLTDGVTVGLDVPITVTIGAADWYGEVGGGILVKNDNPAPPNGAGLTVFGGDLYVYRDPCQWSGTEPDSLATTAAELVAALAAQASRDASEPVDITLDGRAGKAITLHVPDDAVFSDCDMGTFGSWTVSIAGAPGATPYRYHQGPGQIDEIWAVDVDGVLAVIDWSHYAGTPAADVAELQAIVESATFP